MLGELNSSHQRFNSYGEEERAEKPVRTMETGIVFANTAPYQVQRVLHGSAADKKDLALLPGDELVQVVSLLIFTFWLRICRAILAASVISPDL